MLNRNVATRGLLRPLPTTPAARGTVRSSTSNSSTAAGSVASTLGGDGGGAAHLVQEAGRPASFVPAKRAEPPPSTPPGTSEASAVKKPRRAFVTPTASPSMNRPASTTASIATVARGPPASSADGGDAPVAAAYIVVFRKRQPSTKKHKACLTWENDGVLVLRDGGPTTLYDDAGKLYGALLQPLHAKDNDFAVSGYFLSVAKSSILARTELADDEELAFAGREIQARFSLSCM
ncbi:hypothetical protein HK405_005449 [Cladochytrium tenue]|nr:hypothetical protein HK405_005449 [Cladochytrium tenue]